MENETRKMDSIMENLPNLSAVNTNCWEGRLLIAAVHEISRMSGMSVEEALGGCHYVAGSVFKNADPIPAPEVDNLTFEEELERLINRHSKEQGSNTPDFILANYLSNLLNVFNTTLQERAEYYKSIHK